MCNSARLEIFGLDPDSDLHGGCSSVVDRGLEAEQVADVDWVVKVHAVDTRCDYNGSCVSKGCDSGRDVDQLEYCPAVDVSHRVRIHRHHLAGESGLGGAYGL